MKAPDFSLADHSNHFHKLSDFLGKWVVLYFYPKDDTPGCTKEACGFRDLHEEIKKLNGVVIGISADTVESHQKFTKKYNLNFLLLSDPEKKVIKRYQAWEKKKFLGREYEGISRITYLINPQGEIVKKYEKVKPETHAREVLEEIRKLSQ
ncbi:MAG: thioredoxin-dependent thiol peroxidase [Patescibacteria group bacterium]|nr:thioredoxin-dependent thiol peroxidase [Patescibacteria group bacterium]